jgi:hypothetical protein
MDEDAVAEQARITKVMSNRFYLNLGLSVRPQSPGF